MLDVHFASQARDKKSPCPGTARQFWIFFVLGLIMLFLWIEQAGAGALEPSALPESPDSALFSLEDIYQRLLDGSPGNKRTGAFSEPGNAPVTGTGHTTDEIMALAPAVDNANAAAAADVLQDKTYWGLRSDAWGLRTGTILPKTLSADSATVEEGYYAATSLIAVDPDLAASNIRAGITIFGITGDGYVVNTASGDATAGDILTGYKAWVAGTEITGSLTSQGNVTATTGSIAVTIPDGYYAGRTVTFSDSDLIATNVAASVNLFGITGTAAVATGNAVAGDVLTFKTFSSAGGVGLTGTMPNRGAVNYTSPGTTNQAIQQGYHSGSGVVAGDANLAAGNIAHNINIFGVTGNNASVVNTSAGTVTQAYQLSYGTKAWSKGQEFIGTRQPGTAPARVPKTGQTISYADGDDGHLRIGAGKVYPRFKDNGNGTVTDNLTGLIWLKNANCFGSRNWATALSDASTLASGTCGLTDGSEAGDWRLPNDNELFSMIDHGQSNPALFIGHQFTDVQSSVYWSSSTIASNTTAAWFVSLNNGSVSGNTKPNLCFIWPVRGGQSSKVAPVPRTGQTTHYSAGDDGNLQNGVAWPNPRFTKHGDGTVTDNLTGLMWMENADVGNDCDGPDSGHETWTDALASAMICNDNAYGGYTDWRLPTVNELKSLTHREFAVPSIPNTLGTGKWLAGDPFTGVQSIGYWSGSTWADDTSYAWVVYLNYGDVGAGSKINSNPVWPVRGGQ